MNIEIDLGAGPCFGVEKAIEKAELILKEESELYTVGDLIHNEEELERLERMGMKTIALDQALTGNYPKVLFRAHGEPPISFQRAKEAGLKVTDATCPIVIRLQKKIAKTYQSLNSNPGQIVIYGNRKHPEVISLLGHCEDQAIIIERLKDVEILDLSKPIYLFSQTTKYRSEYYKIKEEIEKRLTDAHMEASSPLFFNDSSCKIVARRDEQLRDFIQNKDLILFVSGSKSSNGKQLFEICNVSDVESYFISRLEEVNKEWIANKKNIGISGATSTPKWLLEKVRSRVRELIVNS